MPLLDGQPAPGAAADGAVFAPTRVKGGQRPRILATLVIAGVGGLVAMGALDRAATPPRSAAVVDGTQDPAPTPGAQILRSSRPPPRALRATPAPRRQSPTRDLLALDIRAGGNHVFVHGDVFGLDVARVTVRLEDGAGNVAATRSVDIPGGSTAFRIGAVPRFDVQFVLAEDVRADAFLVSATAIDAAGRRLTTLLQVVAPSTDPM